MSLRLPGVTALQASDQSLSLSLLSLSLPLLLPDDEPLLLPVDDEPPPLLLLPLLLPLLLLLLLLSLSLPLSSDTGTVCAMIIFGAFFRCSRSSSLLRSNHGEQGTHMRSKA